MGPGWFVMVFHGSRLVFHGLSPECTRPKLYPGLTIQSRSAARRAAWDLVLIIGLIAAHNHNFVALISHLVTLLWPLSVIALYPPVITIVFPLLSGIPQAPAPLSFKGNESPPEREMPL